MRIFINYRRHDSGAYAHLLRDRLTVRFGEANVFLDVVDLEPGMHWLEQIRSRGGSAGVLLALIGPGWESQLRERSQSTLADGTADMVKQEIELALTRGSGVVVVPVLIDDAVMPEPESLPRSLRPLAYLQAAPLRHSELEGDIERLLIHLEHIDEQPSAGAATEPAIPGQAVGRASPEATPPGPDSPDSHHYDAVLNYMLASRSVVPVLGPRVNGGGSDNTDPVITPDARGLADQIAASFALNMAPNELARVAQQVLVTAGSPDLHDAIRRVIDIDAAPSPVHRFLAQFPRKLEAAGWPRRYQMIVTTNYDAALERAFESEDEPYDLAVYMANGNDRGRFVHFPFDRDPEAIVVPNRYGKLPIEDDGELRRTLIVKVNGAVDGSSGGYRWRENYVVTEDQYIEYLSHNSVESLVPVQILDKLNSLSVPRLSAGQLEPPRAAETYLAGRPHRRTVVGRGGVSRASGTRLLASVRRGAPAAHAGELHHRTCRPVAIPPGRSVLRCPRRCRQR
jgi:hypothetical protein